MSYYDSPAIRREANIDYQAPIDICKDDTVWVKWDRYRHANIPEQATPTKVLKIYDDGNIIHQRNGYDDPEFAWARDVIAKSPRLPFDRMPYRTVAISEIVHAIRQASLEEG